MKYRKLGKTGLDISVIGVGTWQFGGEWGKDFNQSEVNAILDAAQDRGINFIDTAECYGDHLSESLIGERTRKDREKWILATKFGHHFHDFLDRTRHFDPADVVKQLDQSLKSLKTDYIDLYQMHSSKDHEFLTEGLWEALEREKEKGKIRHLGLSISGNDNIYQTSRAGEVGAESIQVVYNRLDQVPEKEVFPSCREQNLGVLARVPMASGLLSGKYRKGHVFTGSDVRATRDKEELARQIEEVEQIYKTEVPEGVPMASWALAWCLKDPVVTAVIPGCKNIQQVNSNADAADLI
jgi:aryl-alcohol dehydrogenase-like predicted oxidoreductase